MVFVCCGLKSHSAIFHLYNVVTKWSRTQILTCCKASTALAARVLLCAKHTWIWVQMPKDVFKPLTNQRNICTWFSGSMTRTCNILIMIRTHYQLHIGRPSMQVTWMYKEKSIQIIFFLHQFQYITLNSFAVGTSTPSRTQLEFPHL